MKFWLMVLGGWLAFSGTLFSVLVFLIGAPVLPSLGTAVVLVTALLWLWSRDVEAEPLSMRESLWNTPEDEEDEVDGRTR